MNMTFAINKFKTNSVKMTPNQQDLTLCFSKMQRIYYKFHNAFTQI